MPAYAASARIVGVTPRLAQRERATELSTAHAPVIDAFASPETLILDAGSRLEAIRERWSQLTFYLFDANSWR